MSSKVNFSWMCSTYVIIYSIHRTRWRSKYIVQWLRHSHAIWHPQVTVLGLIQKENQIWVSCIPDVFLAYSQWAKTRTLSLFLIFIINAIQGSGNLSKQTFLSEVLVFLNHYFLTKNYSVEKLPHICSAKEFRVWAPNNAECKCFNWIELNLNFRVSWI